MSKKPQRLPPTPSVIKKLFAYSGNQCAMPNCKETLVDVSGTMLGNIAHICAAEKGGARYDPEMTDKQRRDISNLFIVCGKHHDIIDDKNNENDYPAIWRLATRSSSRPASVFRSTEACFTASLSSTNPA
jgi:hypothetical protein